MSICRKKAHNAQEDSVESALCAEWFRAIGATLQLWIADCKLRIFKFMEADRITARRSLALPRALRALIFVSAFSLQPSALPQVSGTVNVVFDLADYGLNPQIVQRLVLAPVTNYPGSPGVGTLGTNILIPVPMSRPTGLTGSVTFSNVVTGYPYQARLFNQAQPAQVIGTFSLFFPTNLSGTVNATAGLGTNAGPVFGWVFAPDYATVAASTNITFTTSNGVL